MQRKCPVPGTQHQVMGFSHVLTGELAPKSHSMTPYELLCLSMKDMLMHTWKLPVLPSCDRVQTV